MGAFYAKGVHVGGTIYVDDLSELNGGINLLEARVIGNIEVWSSRFASSFLAPLIHVDHSVFIHSSKFQDELRINGSKIGQHLDLAGNEFASIDLSSTVVGGDLRLEPDSNHDDIYDFTTSVEGALVLRSTHVSVVQDENARIPKSGQAFKAWPPSLDLLGFQYDRFGDTRNFVWADTWLTNARATTKIANLDDDLMFQPDRSLSAYFKSIGDDDTADDILIRAKDLELRLNKEECEKTGSYKNCLRTAQLFLLKYGINYGLARWSLFVLAWSLFFTSLGFAVLSYYRTDNPAGWRFFASLNRLIPVLDLRKDYKDFFDDPKSMKEWQAYYFLFHSVIGYVLALFIVSAFSGIIQAK